MSAKDHFYSSVYVPFVITDDDLVLDTTHLDPVVIPHLAMKSVRDLLSTKIKRSSTFPDELYGFDHITHGKLSIAAISSSTVMTIVFFGLIIFEKSVVIFAVN